MLKLVVHLSRRRASCTKRGVGMREEEPRSQRILVSQSSPSFHAGTRLVNLLSLSSSCNAKAMLVMPILLQDRLHAGLKPTERVLFVQSGANVTSSHF